MPMLTVLTHMFPTPILMFPFPILAALTPCTHVPHPHVPLLPMICSPPSLCSLYVPHLCFPFLFFPPPSPCSPFSCFTSQYPLFTSLYAICSSPSSVFPFPIFFSPIPTFPS